EAGSDKRVKAASASSACTVRKHAEGRATLYGYDAIQFPSTECFTNERRLVRQLRKIIDLVGYEDMRPVDIRVSFVQTRVGLVSDGFLVYGTRRIVIFRVANVVRPRVGSLEAGVCTGPGAE